MELMLKIVLLWLIFEVFLYILLSFLNLIE
jgi:hypothetical protein